VELAARTLSNSEIPPPLVTLAPVSDPAEGVLRPLQVLTRL
jgi:hypothetical protein